MNKYFYLKMALQSIQKNRRIYVPFILAATGMVSMYSIFSFLAYNTGLQLVRGGDSVKMILGMGMRVMMVFSVIFLFYINSFLMKQRKRELGLYCVLGMEKKHVAKILSREILISGIIAIGGGILLGTLFSKACYIILLRIMGNGVKLGFMVPGKAIGSALLVFILLFLAVYAYNYSSIRMIRPLELLQSDKKGEKELKARWFWAAVSLGLLGAGYYIAITCGSPLEAVNLFFIAVLLVIGGTYGLFQTAIVAILKILQRNKTYYYKTKHFVAVSGLQYRMKRNAASLANICILSTVVLVMLSTTVTIYAEIERKKESSIRISGEWLGEEGQKDFQKEATPVLEKYGRTWDEAFSMRVVELYAEKKNGQFEQFMDNEQLTLRDICVLQLISQEDFEKSFGEKLSLKENEIFVYAIQGEELPKEIVLGNSSYRVAGQQKGTPRPSEKSEPEICDTYFLIFKNETQIKEIYAAIDSGEEWSEALYTYYWEISPDLDREGEIELAKRLKEIAKKYDFWLSSGEMDRETFLAVNGSLLFIGIFLGIVFTFATVLIIYYKQMTEGYEDSSRFGIMCKVGMSKAEVWSAIKSQMLLVFFSPVVMAGLHLLAAVPCLEKILILFGVVDMKLFALSAFITFGIFSLLYVCVYGITARTYYHIVNAE